VNLLTARAKRFGSVPTGTSVGKYDAAVALSWDLGIPSAGPMSKAVMGPAAAPCTGTATVCPVEKPYEFVYRAHVQQVPQEGNIAMSGYNIAPSGSQTVKSPAGQDFLTSFPPWFMFATFATTRAMYLEDPENYSAFFTTGVIDPNSGNMISVPTIQIGTQSNVLQQFVPIDSQVYKDITTPISSIRGGFWQVLGQVQVSCGGAHPFIRPSVNNPYLCCVCKHGFDGLGCTSAGDAHDDCFTSPSRCDQDPAFTGCTSGGGGTTHTISGY